MPPVLSSHFRRHVTAVLSAPLRGQVSTGDGWAWAIARPLIGNIYPNFLTDDLAAPTATPAPMPALRAHPRPPWAPDAPWGPAVRGGLSGAAASDAVTATIRRPVRTRRPLHALGPAARPATAVLCLPVSQRTGQWVLCEASNSHQATNIEAGSEGFFHWAKEAEHFFGKTSLT